jgi:hypothetical protein
MKLEQAASKASEDKWIEKYRAALDLSPPEASRYLRVREFIARVYGRIVARVRRKAVEVPITVPQQKKTPSAPTSIPRAREVATKVRRSTNAGKKAAQAVDRTPSRSKLRASNK